jgi:glutaredoxin-related protein
MIKKILFYSINCKHSVKFIEILKKLDSKEIITDFINVDKIRGNRPVEVAEYGITEVPTVVIPDMSLFLAGKEAFDWLSDEKNKLESTGFLSGLDKTSVFGTDINCDTRIIKEDLYEDTGLSIDELLSRHTSSRMDI